MATTISSVRHETLIDRIAAVRSAAATHELAGVLLYSAPRSLAGGTQTAGNAGFFLGYTSIASPTLLLIPVRGQPTVFAAGPNDRRMLEQRVGGIAAVRLVSPAALGPAITEALTEAGPGTGAPLGLAGRAEMPARLSDAIAAAFPRIVAFDDPVNALRSVGTAEDVVLHRVACDISDAMITRAMSLAVEPGMTPARLMADVECAGRRLGADIAKLWLAVGPNPPVTCFEFFELPDIITRGDRVQLGTSVSYVGHFAQGLRMGIRGTPSDELVEVADTLIQMQDAALASLVPGRPVNHLVDVLEHQIDARCPYARGEDPFRFQSCHQLGLDYSEPWLARALSPDRDRAADADGPRFEPGMIFEIHPNFSLPGLGHVSAGDVALVTLAGAEWLTRYPRGLVRLA